MGTDRHVSFITLLSVIILLSFFLVCSYPSSHVDITLAMVRWSDSPLCIPNSSCGTWPLSRDLVYRKCIYTAFILLKAEACYVDDRGSLWCCVLFIPVQADVLSWTNHSTNKTQSLITAWPKQPLTKRTGSLWSHNVRELTCGPNWLMVQMYRSSLLEVWLFEQCGE